MALRYKLFILLSLFTLFTFRTLMEGSNELLSKKSGWVSGWTRILSQDGVVHLWRQKEKEYCTWVRSWWGKVSERWIQEPRKAQRFPAAISRCQVFLHTPGSFFVVFPLGNCLFLGHCLWVPAYTPGMVEAKDGRAERDGGDEEDVVDVDDLDIW